MYKSLKSRAEGSFTLRKSELKEEKLVNGIAPFKNGFDTI